MSDCDPGGTTASTDCSSAPATGGSSFGDPPPDYSTCVSHPAAESSNHSSSGTKDTANDSHPVKMDHIHVNPISVDSASEVYPLNRPHHDTASGHFMHDTASSAPFLDSTPISPNRHDGYVPTPNPYNPQPAYNPSYTAARQNTPRPNVYGRKTIVLQRTDAEISARKRKMIIGLFLGLFIGVVICATILTIVFSIPMHRNRWEDRVKQNVMSDSNYESSMYDRNIIETPVIDPYPANNVHEDNFYDKPWKPKQSDPTTNPLLDDRYKDLSFDKPRTEQDREDDALRAIGIDADIIEKYKDMLSKLPKNDETPLTGISKGMNDILEKMHVPLPDYIKKT